MNYPTHDTDWAASSKGNCWRRKDGINLSAGKRKDGGYWARRDEDFLPGSFANIEEAKNALEDDSVDDQDRYYNDDYWCWP
jgi:hypothetical protein